MRLILILALLFQILTANNEKNISLLDFVELLSLHNNINIFVDENATRDVSFFVPDDVNNNDLLDIFKGTIKKDGFELKKYGNIYFMEKIIKSQKLPYFLNLKYNSFDDVSKYLKFKNIDYEYITASNQFLIYTYQSFLPSILNDLNTIDIIKKQVSLKFSIIEINDDELQEIGADLTSSTVSSDVKSVLTALLRPSESNQVIFQNNYFYSVLKFYNEQKKLNITQSPFVLIQDRSEFNFQAVTNIPYKSSELVSNSTINSTQTTVNYKDVGLKISGVSFINNDFVNLDLNLTIEDILNIVNDTPTTYKRFLKSNSNLKKGQVLILSGIKQSKIKSSDYSIPYISNIPYLGEIFKYKSTSNSMSNISIAIEVLNDGP